MNPSKAIPHPASYRDPSGFIFIEEGIVYRQVNRCYSETYNHLMNSGLYQELQQEGLLLAHEQVDFPGNDPDAYCIIKPEQLSFISYTYEWSFGMLKDAALLTLKIAQKAMKYGMILKDATPFNIQFHQGRMQFIDTLSFELYDESEPWIAYRQFCEHFLAPLALMHYSQKPLTQMLLAYPEGFPLHIASALLPARSKFNVHMYLHLHMNAKINSNKTKPDQKKAKFSSQKLKNILSSLNTAIDDLKLEYKGTWWNYYEEANLREHYVTEKKKIIENWLSGSNCSTAFDAGANDGEFSKLLAAKGISVIGADSDHYAIDHMYQTVKEKTLPIQPLVIDLSNPSPAIGVNNTERTSFKDRMKVDIVLALALIHHLCIGKNIPFAAIAKFFADLGNDLIIEYVPKSDVKIREMLLDRQNIFDWYTEEKFQQAFQEFYQLTKKETVGDSGRVLYYWSK